MQNSERLALIFEGNANRLKKVVRSPRALQLAASLNERARQVRRGQEELDEARSLLDEVEKVERSG